jgi:hypothetical protein
MKKRGGKGQERNKSKNGQGQAGTPRCNCPIEERPREKKFGVMSNGFPSSKQCNGFDFLIMLQGS